MPIAPLKLIAGVNVEFTPTLNESGVSSCNLIRWRAGLPEKLGGWDKYYPFLVSGTPRDLHAWQDLNDIGRLEIGTTSMLGVITSGALKDITPQTKTTNPNENFSTTNGSPTVTVVDAGISNVTTFDAVFFNTPISVGGLILSGLYPIASITGATSYTITAASNATATVANGGAVTWFTTTNGIATVAVALNDHGLAVNEKGTFPISTTVGGITINGTYTVSGIVSVNAFQIVASNQATSGTTVAMNSGNAQIVYYITLGPPAVGIGYGLGAYGAGGYGTGRVPNAQTGTPITATDWTSDNWGEILLACPKGGAIYYWSPNGGFENAAQIDAGPVFNGGIFIAMPQQILVAWGSTVTNDIGVDQDPLLVRWSDVENFLEWTVTSSTQAGSFHIPTGSKIMGGLQGPRQALIWTDLDVYVMRYLRPPLVFGFDRISSGCGLIGPHAAAVMRGNVYWMSQGNFFIMSGEGIKPIPCSVWDAVFQNLNTTHAHKCVAAPNSMFGEIAFHYPSAGSTENDLYVKFNINENTWDYGELPMTGRSAWIDQSVLGEPIGATPSRLIYQHETSQDADGQAMNPWFETGYFVISEGQDLMFMDWFFPDMKFGLFDGTQGATVLVTIYATDYPNQTERSYGPFSTTSAKNFVNTRLRGRQIRLRFESVDLGSFWRLGNMRSRVAKAGRR